MPYITFKNENALYHAEKGSTWSNHKYIRIENGRYIYPEDISGSSGSKKGSSTASGAAKTNIKADQDAKAKAKAQYQIDYIKDIKTAFDDELKYNSEQVKYIKERAKIKNIKNPQFSDIEVYIDSLELRVNRVDKFASTHLKYLLKDNNLSEETKVACAKYIMQKTLSQLATISPVYRNIVNSTNSKKDNVTTFDSGNNVTTFDSGNNVTTFDSGNNVTTFDSGNNVTTFDSGNNVTTFDDYAENVSKMYKKIKKLYEKVSNSNSFSKEDLDEFDNIYINK